MTGRTFICDACLQAFTSDWSEEKAVQEAELNFGKGIMDRNPGVICDDCYKEIGLPDLEDLTQ